MIERMTVDHWDKGTKDRICADKINELIGVVNLYVAHPMTALDTKQEKIGSGHTGACQEGCQCDVAKMGKQEKCPEYSEVEKNIIKWWREGNITLHYNSNYKGAIIGTGTMGEGE